jgi:hypothetical protein
MGGREKKLAELQQSGEIELEKSGKAVAQADVSEATREVAKSKK